MHGFRERRVNRRSVLQAGACGLASLAAAPLARVVHAAEVDVTAVTDRMVLLGGAGGNVLALTADAGLVVVDSGAAEASDLLVPALRRLAGGKRLHTLFNTHGHLEQVGANAVFGAAGAAIIAHEKTRLRLSTDYYLPAEDRYRKALPAEARPTIGFYTDGAATVGREHIEYGYLIEAHTDGDIYVYFRDSNVLAVGDAVSPVRDPELDWFGGGWLGGRVDSMQLLLDISDAETKIVPSYGPVVSRAELQSEHDMLAYLFERMRELVRMGLGAEDILALGLMDEVERRFEDPFNFVYAAHKGMWAHHNKLSPDVV